MAFMFSPFYFSYSLDLAREMCAKGNPLIVKYNILLHLLWS